MELVFGEIEYCMCADFVRKIDINKSSYFELFGISYALFLDSKNSCVPAEYHFASDRDGFDIYLWENLEEVIQRPLLLHEIIEVYFRSSGLDWVRAHEATLPWENRYCDENLNSDQLSEFLQLRMRYKSS